MAAFRSNRQVAKNKADQYNDPNFNYSDYWLGRDYEHQSEILAIKRLLRNKHFRQAVDLGGGYGRLSLILEEFADQVVLAEPSDKQLKIAKTFLQKHPEIELSQMQANDLKFKDNSIDLILFVRVMHHLPHPSIELAEIQRVLRPNGYAIIEFANYLHAQNRIKHFFKGQKFPSQPVDIRTDKNRSDNEIPFVNHNPDTVIKQIEEVGLKIEDRLSVSNLRLNVIKKVIPIQALLTTEKVLQPLLAPVYFGPSIFFLVRKAR